MKTGFIDWTEGKINLYIFEKKGGDCRLVDTISAAYEDELNQSVLKSLVKPGIEHIYLSVPVSLLSLRELSFPFSDRNKVKETISYELDGIMLGDVSSYSIDSIITESSGKESRALAVCMDKTKLREIIDLFSSVGLEPIAVTSIDLRFYSKNIDMILEGPALEEKTRIEAAGEELINPLINLRQEDLAYKGDIDRIKKSLRFSGVLVLLLLLIFGADTGIKFLSQKKENSYIKKEITTVYRDTFPGDSRIVDVGRQFRANVNSLIEKKAILGGMPVLDIMLSIANLKNRDIILSELNIEEENILLKGSARSFETVDSLKNSLSSSFSDVKVIDSKASPDKKISFSIIMKEKVS